MVIINRVNEAVLKLAYILCFITVVMKTINAYKIKTL